MLHRDKCQLNVRATGCRSRRRCGAGNMARLTMGELTWPPVPGCGNILLRTLRCVITLNIHKPEWEACWPLLVVQVFITLCSFLPWLLISTHWGILSENLDWLDIYIIGIVSPSSCLWHWACTLICNLAACSPTIYKDILCRRNVFHTAEVNR